MRTSLTDKKFSKQWKIVRNLLKYSSLIKQAVLKREALKQTWLIIFFVVVRLVFILIHSSSSILQNRLNAKKGKWTSVNEKKKKKTERNKKNPQMFTKNNRWKIHYGRSVYFISRRQEKMWIHVWWENWLKVVQRVRIH